MIANQLLSEGIEEIHRIELLLSEFLPDSDTSKINNFAFDHPVEISTECYELISRSLDISSLSVGAFDITVGPLKRIYSFKNEFFNMPEAALIQQTKEGTGYRILKLNKVCGYRKRLCLRYGEENVAQKGSKVWIYQCKWRPQCLWTKSRWQSLVHRYFGS